MGDVMAQREESSNVKEPDNAAKASRSGKQFENLILFPLRALWNLFVIAGTITLEVMWLGFVFGSVVGFVLLLIFMPEGFLLPLALFGLLTRFWPEE